MQPVPGSPIDPAKPDGFKFPPRGPALRSAQRPMPGVNEPGDPYTPLMRAYAGDTVQVRALVGAHTLRSRVPDPGRALELRAGLRHSGYKNAQAMGISEHFEMHLQAAPRRRRPQRPSLPPFADYLVSPSSSTEGLANGDWTIMRAFANGERQAGHQVVPHPVAEQPARRISRRSASLANKIKRDQGPVRPAQQRKDQVRGNLRVINVTATTVSQALPEKKLSFNPRRPPAFQLNNILLFVRSADLDAQRPAQARRPARAA